MIGRRDMAITERRLTLEAFLKLPEEKPALELVDGVVQQKVAPQWQHALLQPDLAAVINRYARPRKLAAALTEIREAFGRDSLVPDVGVYRWKRLPRTADGRQVNAAPAPPDVAIEIRSPGQSVGDLIEKCRRYPIHGAHLTLVIDPETESVIRVAASQAPVTLRGNDRVDLALVLPDFNLTVRALFEMLQLD